MKGRVLIVDDNRDLAENLGELLELEGFHPIVLSSSREALDRARELEFDVALLDVRMPEVDGIDLCSALARAHPSATFLLMTAFTAEARLAEAHDAGAVAVLPKPVPFARLLALLIEGARTVLVVEDDDDLRASLREALEARGYDVVTVASMAEAEARVTRGVPPYAILELVVRDQSSEPLAKRLVDAGARVIVLGVARDGSDFLASLAPRGVFYLGKPFSPPQLVDLLARLARRDLA